MKIISNINHYNKSFLGSTSNVKIQEDFSTKISKEEYIDKYSKEFDDLSILFLALGFIFGGHKITTLKKSTTSQKFGFINFILSALSVVAELTQGRILSKIYDKKMSNK